MTKKERNIPAYERALEEARANLPISMDRMTGEERVLFNNSPAIQKKSEDPIKMNPAVIMPDWLTKVLIEEKIDNVDLGNAEMLCQLITAVYTHEKKVSVLASMDPDLSECSFFVSISPENDLSEAEKENILTHALGMLSVIFGKSYNENKEAAKKVAKPKSKVVKKKAVKKKAK